MSTAISKNTAQTPQSAPPIRHFSKRQKAAIVVRLLLAEDSGFSLVDLPESAVIELTRQMTTLRYIDQHTMQLVAQEFLSEMDDVGLFFPSAIDGALAMLDGAIDPETATRMRAQQGVPENADPWDKLRALDLDLLVPVLKAESVEVAAVLLSKLKVTDAAELLGKLPGEKARRITYAVSLTGDISPKVVHKIGQSLASQFGATTVSAFADDPVERVGAILNFSPAATRDDVLVGLEETDAGFASQVRRAIFTFADIPARLKPTDVPKITRDIDPKQLITALTAATGDDAAATEFILENMSKRMSGQLREEMEALGSNFSAKDGDSAMTAVIIQIRELESDGQIVLNTEEEEDS